MDGTRVQDPLYSISDAGKKTKLLYFKEAYPQVQITPELKAKVGVSVSHPHREAHELSAKALLAQGHSEESVVVCIIDTLEKMKLFEEMDKSLPPTAY